MIEPKQIFLSAEFTPACTFRDCVKSHKFTVTSRRPVMWPKHISLWKVNHQQSSSQSRHGGATVMKTEPRDREFPITFISQSLSFQSIDDRERNGLYLDLKAKSVLITWPGLCDVTVLDGFIVFTYWEKDEGAHRFEIRADLNSASRNGSTLGQSLGFGSSQSMRYPEQWGEHITFF